MTGKAVVHVGTYKTGTTAFQSCLATARRDLESDGVFVLDSESAPGHGFDIVKLVLRPELLFPGRLMDPDSALMTKRAQMAQEVRRHAESSWPTLLVSLEALCLMRTEAEAHLLRELLAGRDISIVAMFREPSEFLRSWRGQLDNMGMPSDSPFPDSYMYTRDDSWLVDYDALLRPLGEVFGESRVLALDYEKETREHGSVVPALWQACGLAPEALPGRALDWINVTDTDEGIQPHEPGTVPQQLLEDRTREIDELRAQLNVLKASPRAQMGALSKSLPNWMRARLTRARRATPVP